MREKKHTTNNTTNIISKLNISKNWLKQFPQNGVSQKKKKKDYFSIYKSEIEKNLPKIHKDDIFIYYETILGTGDFGVVYECDYKGKRCAIKLIYLEKHFYKRPLHNKEIQRELLVSHKMSSFTEFAKIYGFCFINRHLAIVMELLNRGSRKIISKLSYEEKYNFILKTIHGISKLHDNQILHRDIKSNNILFTKINNERIPKIVDFGMSKIKREDLGENDNFSPVGNVGNYKYQPLEVILNKKFSYSSDIFSLGVLIIELVTGNIVWEKQNDFQILERLKQNQKPPEYYQLPNEYKILVDMCCKKDYKNRPTSKELITYFNNINNKKKLQYPTTFIL